jgi:ATP dependent DNA ligase domain
VSSDAARGGSIRRALDPRDQVRWLSHAGAPAKRAACHVHAEGPRLDAALPDHRRCARGPCGERPHPGWRSRRRRFARRPDFGLLHADLAASRTDRLLYYAFDLLYLDGFDLRGAPLAERKGMVSELLAEASERILFAEHLEGDGGEIRERACAMGLEGIVSKQQDAPYRSDRVESWI